MKFRIGDHVRVIAQRSEWFDRVGTVHRIWHSEEFPFQIDGIDGVPLWYAPHELILADPLNVILNDVEGQQLVQNIHDRKEKTL